MKVFFLICIISFISCSAPTAPDDEYEIHQPTPYPEYEVYEIIE